MDHWAFELKLKGRSYSSLTSLSWAPTEGRKSYPGFVVVITYNVAVYMYIYVPAWELLYTLFKEPKSERDERVYNTVLHIEG